MNYRAFGYKTSSFGTLIAAMQRNVLKSGNNMRNDMK